MPELAGKVKLTIEPYVADEPTVKRVCTATAGFLLFAFLRPCVPSAWAGERTRYWIDTDIGGDVDDAYALVLANYLLGRDLIGVSTTGVRPQEKQKIAAQILASLGKRSVSVHAGSGPHNQSRDAFYELYPLWPFRDPFSHGKAFPFQGKAYEKHLPPMEDTLKGLSADEALRSAIDAYGEDLRIISLGPLTNLARVDSKKIQNIGSAFMMGGFTGNRLAYNTAIDLVASARVIKALLSGKVPTTFVGGNTGNGKIVLRHDAEIPLFANAASPTPLGSALIEDTKTWNRYLAQGTDGSLLDTPLADPLTVWLAVHPEQVANSVAGKLTLLPNEAVPGMNFLDERARKLYRLSESTKGPFRFVLSTRKPVQLQRNIVDILRKPFYPNLSTDRWKRLTGYWKEQHMTIPSVETEPKPVKITRYPRR